MKKILTLLLITTLFAACGDDDPILPPNPPEPGKPTNPIPTDQWYGNWNDPADPNYQPKGYNPIEGDWILVQKNGATTNDFLVYRFSTSRVWSESKVKPAEGKVPTYSKLSTYQINNTAFKNEKNVIFKYQVSADRSSLTIFDGSTTQTFKAYDNNNVWQWKGDWNSPASPYYAIYKGNYNPIIGKWKATHVGETIITEGNYLRFNADFTVEKSVVPDNYYGSKRAYQINDTGVQEDAYGIHKSYTYEYRIEGNTLYYKTMLPTKGQGMTYIRYK